MVTPEDRARTPSPYVGVAGVAVILAVTLAVMELIYRSAEHDEFHIMRLALPPVGALSAITLGIWSFLSVERSGLSWRMWLSVWIASGSAAVLGGLAFSKGFPWAITLQGPSALVVVAVLAAAAYRIAPVVVRHLTPWYGLRSLLVFVLATTAVAGMELHLWILLTPERAPYSDLREEGSHLVANTDAQRARRLMTLPRSRPR